MSIKTPIPWIAAAAIIVVVFGTMSVAIQTAQRTTANNPQIQLAEDAASALNHGATPKSLTPGKVDVASSLAPFLIIYDKSGAPVAGNGYLNTSLPRIPSGALNSSVGKKFSVVTWQPQAHVRIAAVSASASHYYVLSGRSLTEVEREENLTHEITAFGGIVSLAVLLGTFLLNRKITR